MSSEDTYEPHTCETQTGLPALTSKHKEWGVCTLFALGWLFVAHVFVLIVKNLRNHFVGADLEDIRINLIFRMKQ